MVNKFISYYKNHWVIFTIDMVAALFIAVIEIFIPLIIRQYLNEVIPNRDIRMAITLAIMLVVFLIITTICRFVISYYGHVMGTKIERDMRNDLFLHLQKMDMKFFANEKTGRLMSRLVGDLRDISELSHHAPEDIFLSFVTLTGSFIILFNINVLLSSLLLISLILMVIFTMYRNRRLSRAFLETRKTQAELNSRVESSLNGISVMKSFTNEKFELARFKDSSRQYQEEWETAYYEMGLYVTLMNFSITFMTIMTVIVGSYLALNGELSIGDLAAFTLYIAYFTSPLKILISLYDMIQKGWSGFARFYELLQVDHDIKSGEVKLASLSKQITFKDISFQYGETDEVIKNYNLEIKKGQSVALVGQTGAGKSTVAKLILRFYDTTSGELLIDGVNIKDYNLASLRNNIGYVEQESYIFFGTIKENIMYGKIDASEAEVISAAKHANLWEFICSLPDGLDTEVGDRGIKLSGGQRQRISLARVFLKNPDILVLDEATSALDNKTELEIQTAIKAVSKNRTMLVIAHRLSTIEDCDLICVMSNGEIIEQGTHEQLLALEGQYATMYHSALKAGKKFI